MIFLLEDFNLRRKGQGFFLISPFHRRLLTFNPFRVFAMDINLNLNLNLILTRVCYSVALIFDGSGVAHSSTILSRWR